MNRTVLLCDRAIDGKVFTVRRIETFNYSGEWEFKNYQVMFGNIICSFLGWPTDNDIKQKFGNILIDR